VCLVVPVEPHQEYLHTLRVSQSARRIAAITPRRLGNDSQAKASQANGG